MAEQVRKFNAKAVLSGFFAVVLAVGLAIPGIQVLLQALQIRLKAEADACTRAAQCLSGRARSS